MIRSTLPLLLVALTAPLALAQVPAKQDPDEKSPRDRAIEAFAAGEAIKIEIRDMIKDLRDEVGVAQSLEQNERMNEALREPLSRQKALRKAFEDAFVEAGFEAFSVTEHRPLLLSAVASVGQNRLRTDPALALRLFRFALDELPESGITTRISRLMLIEALGRNGRLRDGIPIYEGLLEKANENDAVVYRLHLGDLLVATGRIDDAVKVYEKILQDVPSRTQPRDPRRRPRALAVARLKMLKKPIPEPRGDIWIGDDAKPLNELRGKIVVLDCWMTGNGVSRMRMPVLDEIWNAHEQDGVTVLGLTKFGPNGYLPTSRSTLVAGGETVRGIDKRQFAHHVSMFRVKAGIGYPYALTEDATFQAYRADTLPTTIVVGKDGTVAGYFTGSGSEYLVRGLVRTLMSTAKKADDERDG